MVEAFLNMEGLLEVKIVQWSICIVQIFAHQHVYVHQVNVAMYHPLDNKIWIFLHVLYFIDTDIDTTADEDQKKTLRDPTNNRCKVKQKMASINK